MISRNRSFRINGAGEEFPDAENKKAADSQWRAVRRDIDLKGKAVKAFGFCGPVCFLCCRLGQSAYSLKNQVSLSLSLSDGRRA